MLTLVAFAVALGLLIAVHEWGHYRMAVACGVKVLRFSVGFGRPLLRWRPAPGSPRHETEFVLGAFPLGGYVRMLDEREAPVAPVERHRAFNRQSLGRRAAIVAAGPLANLALAVALYSVVGWIGVEEPRPILASPVSGSVAERAGLRGGEWVRAVALDGEAAQTIESFDQLRWWLTRAALDGQDLILDIGTGPDGAGQTVRLPLSGLPVREADAGLAPRIGLLAPLTRPLIGDVAAGSPAERAGLRAGDQVLQIGSLRIVDGFQLRERIRASVDGGRPVSAVWRIERAGRELELNVQPEVRNEGERRVGRIGAVVGSRPEMVLVRQGPVEGVVRGAQRTLDVALLTLRMMGRMLIGESSLRNLSGPLTIADYAGKSASLGFTQYLVFLALISVSLGVLNLLPLPVLDGGHLMYYLWEGVTGHPPTDAWLERLQRAGVAVLLLMMSVALFNDITRLLG